MRIIKVKYHYICVGCPNCHFKTDDLHAATQHSDIHFIGHLDVQKEVIGIIEIP
jgi:hypothetical protein